MKNLKKIMAVLIAAALVFAMGITVFGQTVGTEAAGKGSITINNAAKGETYGVVKIFDATLTSTLTNGEADGIAYTGTIPDALKDYFETTDAGTIVMKDNVDQTALLTAVQNYAKTQIAVAEVESDGSALTFQGLDYGYYAVKSTQGATITIDSLNPNASIYDKNSKTITVSKDVDKPDLTIGDTATYTAVFGTVNYLGEGEDAKQVIEYTIQDTLPEFLSDVTVTSIKLDVDGDLNTTDDQTPLETRQFTNKAIVIPWATEVANSNPKTYTNLYNNGINLVITYTAKLTAISKVNGTNINTVSIHPKTWNGTTTEEPWDEKWQDDAEITTYGAALKKVDGQTKDALTGAEFTVAGLVVTGADGVYTVVSYDPDSDTPSETLVTNSEGVLYILGLDHAVTLSATETKAPNGYNKVDGAISVPAQTNLTKTIYSTSGERYFDAKGNIVSESSTTTTTQEVTANLTDLKPAAIEVLNNKGTELPSTGGIGTTIFYIIGGVVVVAAIIFLVVRSKKSSAK